MQLQMNKEEIYKMYKEAKNPKKEIEVLADLNCVDKWTIVDILVDMGVSREELPKKPGRKSKKEDVQQPDPKETEEWKGQIDKVAMQQDLTRLRRIDDVLWSRWSENQEKILEAKENIKLSQNKIAELEEENAFIKGLLTVETP